jgi:hypothetical protein
VTDRSRVAALLEALEREREGFLAALDTLQGAAARRPLVGAWNARDLTHHVAFWSEHGADALALAGAGRGGDFSYDKSQTDAMNERAAAEGRALSLDQARSREAAAFARFRLAISTLDDGRLDERLGNGDSLEDVIRYDGPDHYAEHAAHLRSPHSP